MQKNWQKMHKLQIFCLLSIEGRGWCVWCGGCVSDFGFGVYWGAGVESLLYIWGWAGVSEFLKFITNRRVPLELTFLAAIAAL